MAGKLAEDLKQLHKDLAGLRTTVQAEKGSWVSKAVVRNKAEEIAGRWFEVLAGALSAQSYVSVETLEKYGQDFQRLLTLSSSPSNRKKSYLETIRSLVRGFRRDIILPVQTRPPTADVSQLHQLLSEVVDGAQSEYMTEAIKCADYGLFRAAAVLGWCAAVDQIHHAIERIGFEHFNRSSALMASQTAGRFKKFNQKQNAHSLSELREVFDAVTLWIMEGMQLIDVNQHTRLKSCFDLRNQCAHPGEAPITEYNLLSFFSDLNEIVFKSEPLSA